MAKRRVRFGPIDAPVHFVHRTRPTRHHWLFEKAATLDRFIETNPFCRIAALIAAAFGFFVLLGTASQIYSDYEERAEERDARRHARIAQAWDVVARQMPGNIGKGEALSYLLTDESISFRPLVECYDRSVVSGLCQTPTEIWNLRLGGTREYRHGMRFEDTLVIESHLAEFSGDWLEFTSSKIISSNILDSSFSLRTSDTEISRSNFVRSTIWIDGTIEIVDSNLSGTSFLDFPAGTVTVARGYALAWEPPRHVSQDGHSYALSGITYCEITDLEEYEREIAKPGGITYIRGLMSGEGPPWCQSRLTEESARSRYPDYWQGIRTPKGSLN